VNEGLNQTKWDGERHATCDSASSSSPRHIERRSVVIVCTAVVFAFRKCCTSSAIRKLLWPSTMLPLFVVYKSDSVRVHHDRSKSRRFCMPVSQRSANDSMTTACSGCTCTDSSRLSLLCCGISATHYQCADGPIVEADRRGRGRDDDAPALHCWCCDDDAMRRAVVRGSCTHGCMPV